MLYSPTLSLSLRVAGVFCTLCDMMLPTRQTTDGQTDEPTRSTHVPGNTDVGHPDRQTDKRELVIIARGHPRPQPRPRLLPNGRVLSVANTHAKSWIATIERTVRNLVESIGGLQSLQHYYSQTDALSVRMQFRFPVTSGRAGRTKHKDGRQSGAAHVFVPDVDNLAKLVLDCLTRRGILLGDDSRVAHLEVTKVWDLEDYAGVTVVIAKADTQASHAGWPTKASDGSALAPTPPEWLYPI